MKSFKLESTKKNDFSKDLLFKFSAIEKSQVSITNEYGYTNKLDMLRNKIDSIDINIWKKVRWYINKYDFLVNDPIINRAFYKFWEILHYYDFIPENTMKIASLAEAPGGFIQGVNIYYDEKTQDNSLAQETNGEWMTIVKPKRKRIPTIYTISLNKRHDLYKKYNLPSYNSTILTRNVRITYGADNTGDISKMQNYEYFRKFTSFSKFDVITADGGFDEGNDFNYKEQLHYALFLTEIFYAISLQNVGGNFLLKTFDLFTQSSLHLLWLLHNVYDEVYICKPQTSRPTNSERYIVCKNFILTSEKQKNAIIDILKSALLSFSGIKKESHFVDFTLFSPNSIPNDFIENVTRINSELLEFQCSFLETATSLVENSDFINSFDQKKEALLKEREEIFKIWKQTFNLSI